MKKLNPGLGVLLGGILVLTLGAQDAIPGTIPQPTIVVGTFDSRAIAGAYVSSESFSEYLRAQQADVARTIKRAREAGDDALLASLEALGPAMQKRIHQQGFGTAAVDEIIARIQDKIPGIAKKAGVDVIVSKWILTYQGPGARFVDVTDMLVAEFDPSEETLKGIRELLAQEPVPLDQLEDH